jgi:2-methylcitrate dehydratase PrpD
MKIDPEEISVPLTSALVTPVLVARASAVAQAALPPDVQEFARHCVLDWAGVALAGSREPLMQMLVEQAREDGGAPVASLIASPLRVSTRQAALLNGAAGHAIDYDDANVCAQGHVTAAVLPAALAVAESRGLGGDALLRAFVAGYEMAGMVGQYLGPAHYARGFHATSTVGSFGAAFAAAVLMDLDSNTAAVALGIAGTQAGGMKAQFGTMCKPLHVGKANENGVTGAQLAARGFTSRTDFLEASQGFGEATSQVSDPAAALMPPAGGSHLLNNLFKYHAACYGTHSTIEAVRAICDAHELTTADIEHIALEVEPRAQHMCDIRRPGTGLEAKFSLRMNAALAAARLDTASPETYVDAIVQRSDLSALRDRVSVRFMPEDWPQMATEVRITTRDGRHLSAHHDSAKPGIDLTRQGERLMRKFLALATPVVGAQQAEAIAQVIGTLETLGDIGVLMSMLSQPTGIIA